MAKTKEGLKTSSHLDHRAGADPAHGDAEWIRIYGDLKIRIGEWHAFNWFGACHYYGIRHGVIQLGHWGVFPAKEALKQHGFDLCLAAGVQRAEIGYSGGYRPKNLPPPDRPPAEGKAVFVMPRPGTGRAHLTQEGVTMPTKNDEVEGFL